MALAARNALPVSHRSRENLLLILPLLLLVILRLATAPPSTGWERIPMNVLGVALLLGGLSVRIIARQWKTEQAHGALVTTGLYGYIRHPLYVGSFLLGLGLALIVGDWLLLALFLVLFLVNHGSVIRAEERDLHRAFGGAYASYRAEVPAFIPALPLRQHRRVLPYRLKEALIRECDAIFLWLALPLALQLLVWGFHSAPHPLLPVATAATLAALTLAWAPVKRQYTAMIRRERAYSAAGVSLRRQNR